MANPENEGLVAPDAGEAASQPTAELLRRSRRASRSGAQLAAKGGAAQRRNYDGKVGEEVLLDEESIALPARRKFITTRRRSKLPDATKLVNGTVDEPREQPPSEPQAAEAEEPLAPTPRRSSRIAAAQGKAPPANGALAGGCVATVNTVSAVRASRGRKSSRGSVGGAPSALTPKGAARRVRMPAVAADSVASSPMPSLITVADLGCVDDDPNTSFRTAIMGDATPHHEDARGRALFTDDSTPPTASDGTGGSVTPTSDPPEKAVSQKSAPDAGCGPVVRAEGAAAKAVVAALGEAQRHRRVPTVEREGYALAAALIEEEEALHRRKPAEAAENQHEALEAALDVMVCSPPDGDAPSRSVETAQVTEWRQTQTQTTPPEVAVERPKPSPPSEAGSSEDPSTTKAPPHPAKAAKAVQAVADAGAEKKPSPAGDDAAPEKRSSAAPAAVSSLAAARAKRLSRAGGSNRARASVNGPVVVKRPQEPALRTMKGCERPAGRTNTSSSGGGAPEAKSGESSGSQAAQKPAPPAVASVPARSHLLAPTAASRARSLSPTVGTARGRILPGSSSLDLTAPAQGTQRRASSTGRRALTTPKTPNLRTSIRAKVTSSKAQESTEDREMRMMEEKKEELKQMTRRSKASMERGLRGSIGGPVRGTKLQTALDKSGSDKENEESKAVNKKTPSMAPKLRTEVRAASYAKLTTKEEREEAELAEMRKHQFKARPYKPGGVGLSGEKGVFRPRPSEREPTQPAPFVLRTEDRAAKRPPSPVRNRDEEELQKQFKARPLPDRRNSSFDGVGRHRMSLEQWPLRQQQQAQQDNAASSSALAARRRSTAHPHVTERRAEQSERRSGGHAERFGQRAEPRPFHLRSEERGRVKQALLAQRLDAQRRQDEAASRVRARPMPPASLGFIPAPSERPPTETVEFRLAGQIRHERAEREFQEMMRQEEERARRAAEVRALPLPDATYDPETLPPRMEVRPTNPADVRLHSTARAEDRANWEKENQARLEAEEQQRARLAEAEEENERLAVAELRRKSNAEGGMSFKATPIAWNSDPVMYPQLSAAALTQPITPNLQTKRRATTGMSREQMVR